MQTIYRVYRSISTVFGILYLNYLFMLKLWNSGIKFRQVLNLCLFIFVKFEIWLHTKFDIFQGPFFSRSVKMKKHKMNHLSPLLWPKMEIIKGYFSQYYLKNLIANLKKKTAGSQLKRYCFILFLVDLWFSITFPILYSKLLACYTQILGIFSQYL